MDKKERRKYIFAQLDSLPNAFQYVEVTQYIESLEQQLKKKDEVIEKCLSLLQIGINTYNNGGSRRALFGVISDLKEILEDKEV